MNQYARPCIGQNRPQLALGVQRVERHRHRPRGVRREQGDADVGGIAHDEGDALAGGAE